MEHMRGNSFRYVVQVYYNVDIQWRSMQEKCIVGISLEVHESLKW